MVTFSWPWVLLLFPLPLIFYLLKSSQLGDKGIVVPARIADAFDAVSIHKDRTKKSRLVILWLAWTALLLALSQPEIPGDAKVQPASGRTIMLAVDLSSSMERKDFTLDNEPVDRLTVVKKIANQFILNRAGDRIGLVLFSTDTFVASPPSFDLESVAQTLASSGIGMAGRTTAIGDALGMAISNLRTDTADKKAIILLSDGTNNAGSVEPESAAELAQQLGIAIHTIGLGSDDQTESTAAQLSTFAGAAADLDEATLAAIAEISGGQFFRASTTAQLAEIYTEIDQLEGNEARPPPIVINQPISPLFSLCVLILSLLYASLQLRPQSSGL